MVLVVKIGPLLICVCIVIAVDFFINVGDNEDSSGDKSEGDATHQG